MTKCAETRRLQPYRQTLAGTLLLAREAVMAPIRPVLRDIGITEQQWRVLRVLQDQGELDPSRVADAAVLHAPSVTRILKDLLDQGLIRRGINPTDKRRSIVSISPKGRALINRTVGYTYAILDHYTESFGAERLDNLRSELEKLYETIQSRPPPPPTTPD